jgi:vacuolar-type H+-ATPase subunit E/Vma4
MLNLFEKAECAANRKKIDYLPIFTRLAARQIALDEIVEQVEEELKTLRNSHCENTLNRCIERLNEPLVVHALEVVCGANAHELSIKIIDMVEKLGTTQPVGTRRALGGGRKKKQDKTATCDMFGGAK